MLFINVIIYLYQAHAP